MKVWKIVMRSRIDGFRIDASKSSLEMATTAV